MRRLFVVVSGLPGSGKTTLARPLARTLSLPLFDKDDLLESLFASLGAESPEDRSRLSRASDALLEGLATASSGAVLSSFWRREAMSSTSGTPTDWLRSIPDAVLVEVFCLCPSHEAAERFHRRQRHSRHFDERKTLAGSRIAFEQLANAGPLGVGPLVHVDTTGEVDVPAVTAAILDAAGQVH